jgi:hypothetical protein
MGVLDIFIVNPKQFLDKSISHQYAKDRCDEKVCECNKQPLPLYKQRTRWDGVAVIIQTG